MDKMVLGCVVSMKLARALLNSNFWGNNVAKYFTNKLNLSYFVQLN